MMIRALLLVLLSSSFAYAQQGQAIGPTPPCSAFGTTTGTCVQGAAAIVAPSVTSPIIAGGSGAASSLTLESTSGTGTTDSIIFATGSQVTRASIATGGQMAFGPNASTTSYGFDFNLSASNTAITGLANTLVRFVSGSGVSTTLDVANFGTLGNTFRGIAAGGTLASPTASISGLSLHNFLAYGYDGAAFQLSGAYQINTTQLWTGSARGTKHLWYVTPDNSTTLTLGMTLQSSGGLSIGSATDPLAGGLQINGQTFAPNITTSSAAQTGTVCWTTGTGKFTVDTTLGCLASSARFKNIIGEVTPAKALDIVDRTRTVSFTRKEEYGGNLDSAEQFGLTAEQAATVDERLIARDTEGQLLGVRYMEFTSVLAGAVRQLKADNDNLRSCQASWKCRIFGVK